MRIDLHGMSVATAIAKSLQKLFSFEESYASTLEIITGVGTSALFIAIEQLLIDENYDFEIIGNNAGFLVSK